MDSPWLWSWARKRPGEADTRTVQLGDSDRVSFVSKQSGHPTGPWGRGRKGFIENSLSPMAGWRDGSTRACGFVIFRVFRCLPPALGVRPCAHACIGG